MESGEDVYGYVILNPYNHEKVDAGTKFNRAISDDGNVVFFSMRSSHPPDAAAQIYSHTKLIGLGRIVNIDYGTPLTWSCDAPMELCTFLHNHGVLPCDDMISYHRLSGS